MHWKLQCLQPALVNRMGPILLHGKAWLQITQPMLQKLNELGYKVLPHLPYSPNLLPTDYHFFKHLNSFLQGKCFHNQQEAENASQQLTEFWSIDFYTTGINLFFIGKNVLIVTVLILINKDVFEPSYSGLKFTVWNHSYFCTNLIELIELLPGEGNGTPLQHPCLENPMDRGAWQATVHGVAKSPTRLSDWHSRYCCYSCFAGKFFTVWAIWEIKRP